MIRPYTEVARGVFSQDGHIFCHEVFFFRMYLPLILEVYTRLLNDSLAGADPEGRVIGVNPPPPFFGGDLQTSQRGKKTLRACVRIR